MHWKLIKLGKYAIPLFIVAKIASCSTLLTYTANKSIQESRIEQITKDKVIIENPGSNKRYIVDFSSETVLPYNSEPAKDILNDSQKNDSQNYRQNNRLSDILNERY